MRYFMMIIFLVFILGAQFYVFYRFWQMLPNNVIIRTVLIVLGVALVSSLFVSMAFRNSLPSSIIAPLYNIGTSWFFIFIYFLIVFLLLDLIRVTHLLPVGKYMYNSWIGFCAVVGLVAIIMLLGNIKYNNKRRVELNIQVDKPLVDSPVKIIALSDLHLGYSIGKKEFEKWIELINKEKPDIVLIAGDAIDNNIRPLYEQNMAESFKKMDSKYGVYMALGNHEYISDISKSIPFLNEAGIRILRDSAALIDDSFYIVGRDDRSNPERKSIKELISTIDTTKPLVLIDHQPYHLEEAEENNIDIQISGHTHHGQIIPVSWITNMLYEKSHGYLKKGDTHIYVSSGIGLWGGKFRIGTQSEYIVINLTGK